MLMVDKDEVKYIYKAIVCNLKKIVEYKLSFISQTIMMFINNIFFLIFWSITFKVSGNNLEFTMKNILYLWSISTIAFGICKVVLGGIDNINKYFISGDMDSYLTQPKNVFINIATSKCHFSAFGDFLYGIIIGIIVAENLLNFLVIIMYGIFASIIYASIMTTIRSLVVFIGDVDELADKYEHTFLINFCLYPEELFGKLTKVILYTIIPVGYIVYMPVKNLFSFNIWNLFIIFIATIIYVIIAKIMFNKVLKKYESGNSISLKV